jgi:hypothetical protein
MADFGTIIQGNPSFFIYENPHHPAGFHSQAFHVDQFHVYVFKNRFDQLPDLFPVYVIHLGHFKSLLGKKKWA